MSFPSIIVAATPLYSMIIKDFVANKMVTATTPVYSILVKDFAV